jgi:hypothetical protein
MKNADLVVDLSGGCAPRGSRLRRFDKVLVVVRDLSAWTSSEFNSLYTASAFDSLWCKTNPYYYNLAGVAIFNMFDGMSYTCLGVILVGLFLYFWCNYITYL